MLWGASSGFWESVYGHPLSAEVRQALTAASGRFDEAVFFAKCALEQPPDQVFTNEVTWFVGAHLAAYISITDAARVDYRRVGREISPSVFDLEVKLRPNEDPVSANRAYRDMRNLRTHCAAPLLVLERRRLIHDLKVHSDEDIPLRWYFQPLQWGQVRELKTPQLCELDVVRFNRYLWDHPIIDVMGQMLLVIRAVMMEAAKNLRPDV